MGCEQLDVRVAEVLDAPAPADRVDELIEGDEPVHVTVNVLEGPLERIATGELDLASNVLEELLNHGVLGLLISGVEAVELGDEVGHPHLLGAARVHHSDNRRQLCFSERALAAMKQPLELAHGHKPVAAGVDGTNRVLHSEVQGHERVPHLRQDLLLPPGVLLVCLQSITVEELAVVNVPVRLHLRELGEEPCEIKMACPRVKNRDQPFLPLRNAHNGGARQISVLRVPPLEISLGLADAFLDLCHDLALHGSRLHIELARSDGD
mmetsp:Transcript_9844/g.22595  ORF Transcript_9844/g.22595 Transcript_9844/m.22595 type:complete len:266 (-) Transcript_9844:1540-2337(-)